jgi:xylan 1,4-beta-xylosidase
LTARPGWLRLYGRESLGSLFKQSLVARRQQSHCYSAETVVDFEPESFQQMAGLVCYYNGAKYHYFHISHDETAGRLIRVMSSLPDQAIPDSFTTPIPLPAKGLVHLRVEVDYERLYFGFKLEGMDWQWLPQLFDAAILSDEAGPIWNPSFTGAFVGMCCQDLSGSLHHADFDYFLYREREYNSDSPE